MKGLLIKSLFLSFIVGLGVYGYFSLPDVSVLRKNNPKTTALMELRDEEYPQRGRQRPARQHIWAPYRAISENLKRAILISEDAAFFSHSGVDLYELKESIKKDWDKGTFERGASTITMQLARNLYLNPSKNPMRKLQEVVITWQLEQSLSKQRIFEIYLNVVEWGPGIYGAEAAARHYFAKSAADLTPVQSATLAALLPNPRNPREKGLVYRRNLILTRLFQVGYISEVEFNRTKSQPLFNKAQDSSDESQPVSVGEPLITAPEPSANCWELAPGQESLNKKERC